MNLRLVCRMLGVVAMLIGGTMVFSLPWAHPSLGHRGEIVDNASFETRGFLALLVSILLSFALGGLLLWWGRSQKGRLYRKEAMAVVGLSWILATLLGALPFCLRGTYRSPAVRQTSDITNWQVYDFSTLVHQRWRHKTVLSEDEQATLAELLKVGSKGHASDTLQAASKVKDPRSILVNLAKRDHDWQAVLLFPTTGAEPGGRHHTVSGSDIELGVVRDR